MDFEYQSAEALAARIPDGASLTVPSTRAGVPMELARALVRRGAKDLHLITVPAGGMFVDLLIGAGCVKRIETSGVSLDEYGPARRFMTAVKLGSVELVDATCAAVFAGLSAAEKAVPFMPIRGIIGSDLARYRDDWKVVQNPMAGDGVDDPILLVSAIKPDFAVFHAPIGDQEGNVWVGRERDLITMAHGAAETLVTVEEMVEGDLFDDPRLASGTMSSLYVGAMAVAEKGAWPLELPGRYTVDGAHMADYAKASASDEGFAAYIEEEVLGRGAAA
tara:strand:- start:42 stop:872 length:831 start_codon:yes stop_codon:yes gene_type:complete